MTASGPTARNADVAGAESAEIAVTDRRYPAPFSASTRKQIDPVVSPLAFLLDPRHKALRLTDHPRGP